MAEAGVPDDIGFATKPALATSMLTRTLRAGVPARWVAADEVYRADPQLRAELEAQRVRYVLAIGCDRRIATAAGPIRADRLAAGLPKHAGHRLSAGLGRSELAARLGELMHEALDAQGLTPARAELVLALHQHGEPMVQRALARVLRCTPRHITGLVDALEQRDLVRRTPHPTDRRAVLVALTAAGRASARWLTEQRADAAHALFADRPDRELEAFVAVAEYMLARLDGR